MGAQGGAPGRSCCQPCPEPCKRLGQNHEQEHRLVNTRGSIHSPRLHVQSFCFATCTSSLPGPKTFLTRTSLGCVGPGVIGPPAVREHWSENVSPMHP